MRAGRRRVDPGVEGDRAAEQRGTGKASRIVEQERARHHHAGAEAVQVRAIPAERLRRIVQPCAQIIDRFAQRRRDGLRDRAALEPSRAAALDGHGRAHARVRISAREVVCQLEQIVFVGTAAVEEDERRPRADARGTPPSEVIHGRCLDRELPRTHGDRPRARERMRVVTSD